MIIHKQYLLQLFLYNNTVIHLSLVTESILSQSNFLYLNVFKIPLVNKFWLKKTKIQSGNFCFIIEAFNPLHLI